MTISNNNKTTGSTCTFSAAKLVNQNIQNPPACVTSGTCGAGTQIKYQVKAGTYVDFYVLKDSGTSLTLIAASPTLTGVQWSESKD